MVREGFKEIREQRHSSACIELGEGSFNATHEVIHTQNPLLKDYLQFSLSLNSALAFLEITPLFLCHQISDFLVNKRVCIDLFVKCSLSHPERKYSSGQDGCQGKKHKDELTQRV